MNTQNEKILIWDTSPKLDKVFPTSPKGYVWDFILNKPLISESKPR